MGCLPEGGRADPDSAMIPEPSTGAVVPAFAGWIPWVNTGVWSSLDCLQEVCFVEFSGRAGRG